MCTKKHTTVSIKQVKHVNILVIYDDIFSKLLYSSRTFQYLGRYPSRTGKDCFPVRPQEKDKKYMIKQEIHN